MISDLRPRRAEATRRGPVAQRRDKRHARAAPRPPKVLGRSSMRKKKKKTGAERRRGTRPPPLPRDDDSRRLVSALRPLLLSSSTPPHDSILFDSLRGQLPRSQPSDSLRFSSRQLETTRDDSRAPAPARSPSTKTSRDDRGRTRRDDRTARATDQDLVEGPQLPRDDVAHKDRALNH